jgi:hypothetical protein
MFYGAHPAWHVYQPGILAKASRLASKQISDMAVVESFKAPCREMQIYDGDRREWLV